MGLRYVADQTADGMPMVLDTASTLAGIVCRCRTDADAEMVARTLNTQGAVDALARVERYCRTSTTGMVSVAALRRAMGDDPTHGGR